MGLAAAPAARYESAIKKLFPRGDYWDKQFTDPQSDTSLFVKAKAIELKRFRERMGALLNEAKPESTTGLIDDWERVILNDVFSDLAINQRRLQLISKNDLRLNRAELQKIAAVFGLNIQDISTPYRPRCFGFARFGQERIGCFLTFFVVQIAVAEAGQTVKAEFEEAVRSRLLANHIPIFSYGGG